MNEFMTYFLGVGSEGEFQLFTFAHFAPIIIMLLLIYLIYRYQDVIRESEMDRWFRYAMAFILICSEMAYYWRLVALPSLGPNPVEHLPIAVCGWVAIFCSYMVIGKSQTLFDISYFWLLSGSIFALLTPSVILNTGPTRFRYYQFWIEHIGGFIALFYMIFVHKMRPNFKSMIKSYVALMILAGIAYFANDMIGTGANYLFMGKPGAAPSILDILPPIFAVRLVVMFSVISLLFILNYLPWYLKDRKIHHYHH